MLCMRHHSISKSNSEEGEGGNHSDFVARLQYNLRLIYWPCGHWQSLNFSKSVFSDSPVGIIILSSLYKRLIGSRKHVCVAHYLTPNTQC